MKSTNLPKYFLNILIGLLAVALLGTLGCSSSAENPVGTGFDSPQQLAMNDEGSSESSGDREAQIFWYEYPESATEPNDTKEEAAQVYHSQLYNGHIDAETDQNDYFRIELPVWPASIYVKLGWTGDAWLNLYVYDNDLNPVVYNNMPGSGPKELFCYQLDHGTYYVRVKAFEGASDYRIKFGVGRQWYETANDTIETTTWDESLMSDGIVSVVSDTEDQNDYLKVDVPGGFYVQANLSWVGLAGTDLNLYLYDVDYNPIVYSNGSAHPEAISSLVLGEGTYYIRVKAAVGEAIYELKVDVRQAFINRPDIFEIPEEPEWFPPKLGDLFDLPFDPEVYMGPMEDLPPQLFNNPPSWNENPGNEHELPQFPEFGY